MTEVHAVNLHGKTVGVIGGGPVAAVRAQGLVDAGARVRVHASSLCEDLRDLYLAQQVEWRAEPLTASDFQDLWLVSVHDVDARERAAIERWAQASKALIEGSDARLFDQATLDSAVADANVSLRAVTAHQGGRVVLVGGGPGADDLITVRGRRELARADVVVTDRLAPVGLLTKLGSTAEIIDVGKTPYRHPVPQHEINAILVERAKRGQYVVRLKGGDPFVLGRGGEEWLACHEAGVPVDVVPGVTSAFAAPLAAGVPVTHRSVASGVLMISGHDEVSPDVLAAWPHTIVVLMGMGRLAELTTALIGAGKSADTPAAVVQSAHTPQQRSVQGTLGSISAQVVDAGLTNPAVIVIGDVVGQLDPATAMTGEPVPAPLLVEHIA